MLRERHYLLRKRYSVILHARAPPKITKHDHPGSIVAHLTETCTDLDCMINKRTGGNHAPAICLHAAVWGNDCSALEWQLDVVKLLLRGLAETVLGDALARAIGL